MNDDDIVYARPDGWHYHASKSCIMLSGSQFKDLGYKEITFAEAKKRNLWKCSCTPR